MGRHLKKAVGKIATPEAGHIPVNKSPYPLFKAGKFSI